MRQVEDAPSYMKEKNKIVWAGAERSLEYMKKAGVKVGIGTDLIGPEHAYQSREFALRSQVFSNAEILRQATSIGAQLVAESGPLNPYGKLGVIEKGAVADLLLVEKNPLEDVSVLEDAENNLAVIMKGGSFVKGRPGR
jgi:imidazolonepropionase-like amidohydrolase